MTQMDSDNGNILIRVGVTAASLRNSNSKLCDDNYTTKTCIQSSNRLINKILLFYSKQTWRRLQWFFPSRDCVDNRKLCQIFAFQYYRVLLVLLHVCESCPIRDKKRRRKQAWPSQFMLQQKSRPYRRCGGGYAVLRRSVPRQVHNILLVYDWYSYSYYYY